MKVESKCPKRDQWIPISKCDCATDEETGYYHHVNFDGVPFSPNPLPSAEPSSIRSEAK